MENKIKTNHHEPIVYRLYDYLKKNHLGIEYGISKPELAQIFGITERQLRRLTKEINTSEELDKIVSTAHCCYICKTKAECEITIRNTYRTAISLLKKGKAMEKKVGLNKQVKMRLGEFYKDIVETFSEEE